MFGYYLIYLDVLYDVGRASTLRAKIFEVTFHGEWIEAKLMFDCKSLRATAFEMVEYFGKIGLSLSEMVGYEIEKAAIESMISK